MQTDFDSTTVLPSEEPGGELIDLYARCDVLQDQVDGLRVRPSDDMTIFFGASSKATCELCRSENIMI